MDLSKLPKLSQTDAPPPEQAGTPPQQPSPQPIPLRSGVGADVWFNSAVGWLLIFLGKEFGRWLLDKFTGRAFHWDPIRTWPDGSEVSFFQRDDFLQYNEMGFFIFGVVVLTEAAVKAIYGMFGYVPRPLALIGVLIALAGTAINLWLCFVLFKIGQIPIVSGLGVAYGGYIVMDLLGLLKMSSVKPRSAGGV